MMESKCKKCMNGYPSVECVNCGTKFWHDKPYRSPTNADRIRKMSDDELAKFLSTKLNDDFYECPDLTLQWLQQPAEEEQT